MLNSIVALVYFPLHIHKLFRLTTRRALVSDAPTPPSCGFRYLGQMEFETGSGYPGNATGYPVPKPGNAANHYWHVLKCDRNLCCVF